MRRAALTLLTLALLTRPLLAADVVGQAVVDGKVVDLLSDGSWVFHEAMEKPMADEHAMEDHSDGHEDHAMDDHSEGHEEKHNDHGKDEDHAMDGSEEHGKDEHADGHEDHAKEEHGDGHEEHADEDHAEGHDDHAMKDQGEDHAMDAALCEDVAEGVAFCGHSIWTTVATEGSAADAAFRHPEGVFSQIIVEEVGRADGLDLEAIRETILATAANAMGGAPEDVDLLDLTKAEIDGREAASLIYHGEIGGVEVVFANTVLLMDQKTLQAVTIAPEATLSDGHRAAHAGFLADLRVVE